MTTRHKSYTKLSLGHTLIWFYDPKDPVRPDPIASYNEEWNVTVSDDFVGGDMPNWKQVIASGGSATNDFVKYGRKVNVADCIPLVYHTTSYRPFLDTYLQEWSGFRYMGTPEQPNLFDFKPNMRYDLIAESNQKIYDKIYAEHNSFNGYAFLGEIKDTIHLIRHPMSVISDLTETYIDTVAKNKAAFRHQHSLLIRKGRLLRSVNQRIRNQKRINALLSKERKLASNLWLQLRFGVLPLIQDVQNFAQTALDQLISQQERYKWYKATSKGVVPGLDFIPDIFQLYGSYYKNTYDQKHRGNCRILAREKLELRGPNKELLDVLAVSSGLLEPGRLLIPALWDLTPLSVFADYFVNVNSVLTAALTDTSKIDHVELQYRESKDTSTTTSLLSGITSGWRNLAHQDGYCIVSNYRYQRKEWALTIPSITFTLPIGSPIRLANLAAFLNNVAK